MQRPKSKGRILLSVGECCTASANTVAAYSTVCLLPTTDAGQGRHPVVVEKRRQVIKKTPSSMTVPRVPGLRNSLWTRRRRANLARR
jgi:hypothetical protein